MANKWDNPQYRKEYYRKYRKIHLEERRSYDRNRQKELRKIALIKYSEDPPFCACCGEKENKFLSIDHINGGGNKERNEKSRWVFQYLKKMDYPKGYQVLCFNCNLSKGFYGNCPHRDK